MRFRSVFVLMCVAATLAATIVPAQAATRVKEFPLGAGRLPDEMTLGSDGNVWATLGGSIDRIELDGTVTNFPVNTIGLSHVTTGPDGNVWFTAQNKAGFMRPDGTGELFKLTQQGTPTGITTGPDGNMWFGLGGPPGTNQLVQMSLSGAVLNVFPVNPGPNEGTTGADGNLWWCAGSGVDRVTVTGQVTRFPLGKYCADITSAPDGNLWVAEFRSTGSGTIGKLTPDGALTEFPLPAQPVANLSGITVGPDGNVWFSGGTGSVVGRITTDGTIKEFLVPTPDAYLTGITPGANNTVWVAENQASQVARIRLSV